MPGHSFSQQIANLYQVFERLRKAKLKLSPPKCIPFQKRVKYLGHVVSEQGISPDPGKIEVVKTWLRSATVTEVKRFLGLCSYYCRFVPAFAEIAHPLNHYFSIFMDCRSRRCFHEAKAGSDRGSCPDPAILFILNTDASGTGIRGMLSQKVSEEEERVITYFSRPMCWDH